MKPMNAEGKRAASDKLVGSTSVVGSAVFHIEVAHAHRSAVSELKQASWIGVFDS